MESRQGNSGSNTAIVALVALLVIALIAFGAYAILSNGSNREPTPQPGSTLPVLLPTYSGQSPPTRRPRRRYIRRPRALAGRGRGRRRGVPKFVRKSYLQVTWVAPFGQLRAAFREPQWGQLRSGSPSCAGEPYCA